MFISQIEINLMKQANKAAKEGITKSFSNAKPGMKRLELELILRKWLIDQGINPLLSLEVKYGKTISPSLELLNEILDGDFLSINIFGRLNNYAFAMERVTVVGEPTLHQKAYLDHLIEATNWMIESIVPGRKMTFYTAESRGCVINPKAYEIDSETGGVSKINAGIQFTLPVGMVLCVAPSIKSPEFGTMTHSETIVLMEKGIEILS